jgi:hypothetical protein
MKIRPVGAESFYANGRTDGQKQMIKLLVRFSKFCERAQISLSHGRKYLRRQVI